jgi:hypothetical protein
MKKFVFTAGVFDCIGANDFHLIKEMRKIALPDDGVIASVLFDDYACFVNNRKFPIQMLEHRKHNLSYLINKISISYSHEPDRVFDELIREAKLNKAVPCFVAYDDDKEFVGRYYLRKFNVPVRFIKKYGK